MGRFLSCAMQDVEQVAQIVIREQTLVNSSKAVFGYLFSTLLMMNKIKHSLVT